MARPNLIDVGPAAPPPAHFQWQPPALTASQVAAIGNTYGSGSGNAATGGGSSAGYTPVEGPNIDALRQEEMRAAMAAIRARYQSARIDLRGQRNLLGLEHRASTALSERKEEADLEDTLNDFGGRGIARSGYAAQELAGISNEAALGRAAATAAYRAEVGVITQQLQQGLIDQQQAEMAQAQAAINTAWAMYELGQPL